MKNKNVSWGNLPSQEELNNMTSEELSDLRDALGQDNKVVIPEHVMKWLSSNIPDIYQEKATKIMLGVFANERSPYLDRLLTLAKDKLPDEPLYLENKSLVQEVQERTDFVWLLNELRLRSKEEKEFLIGKFQPDLQKTNDTVTIQDDTLKTQLGYPHLQRYLHVKLGLWKQALDETDQALPVIDQKVVKNRLNEEIAKPFINPSQEYIESTRSQLSSYDYDVGYDGALKFLKKHDEERKKRYQDFLDKLESAPQPSKIKP